MTHGGPYHLLNKVALVEHLVAVPHAVSGDTEGLVRGSAIRRKELLDWTAEELRQTHRELHEPLRLEAIR